MSQHIPLEDLSAHLDGALTEARAAQVSLHLADCPACRQAQAELAWARAFLRAAPLAPLPEGLDFRLPEDEADASARVDDDASGTLVAFPARGTWWGLASVAAVLLLAFLLRPLARGLGLGTAEQAAAPVAETSLDSALSADAPAALPAASPDLDAVVGVAGTQAVDDSRGPTTLAPLATARRADQARLVLGAVTPAAPDATPPTAAAPAAGGEAGGYVPPESPLGSRERAEIGQLQDRSLSGPRATATALGLALAELAPRLTAAPEGDATGAAEAEATWAAGQSLAADLAALLDQGSAASAASAPDADAALREAAAAGDGAAQAALSAGVEDLAGAEEDAGAADAATGTPGLDAAAGAAASDGSTDVAESTDAALANGTSGSQAPEPSIPDPLAQAWIPGLALMVALLALGLMAASRARRRRRYP